MATHIRQLLDDFLKQKEGHLTRQKKIERVIENFLTPAMKEQLSLKAIEGDRIMISSASSGAAYNFNLLKEEILQEIQKQFPQIKTISIKTGAK